MVKRCALSEQASVHRIAPAAEAVAFNAVELSGDGQEALEVRPFQAQ